MGGTQGPTISTTGSITEFSTVVGTPAQSQSFTVSALSLTGDITITLGDPSNFDIKLSTENTWSKSITLTPTAGVVNSTSINVRYNPTTDGLIGEWQSSGTNVAALLKTYFKVDSIYANFKDNNTYVVESFSSGAKTTYAGVFTQAWCMIQACSSIHALQKRLWI
jgi:hypothetical protein